MNTPAHPTLMATLKDAITERHARMEKIPFVTALVNGELPLESYVGQLRAMAVIQSTLMHELAQVADARIRTLLLDRPSRLAHLRKDLSIFDPLYIRDIQAAVGHSRTIADRIRRYRVEQPTDLLAVIYVLEGTTLGNSLHLPDVLKSFGSRTAGAAHYYSGYGNETNEYWQRFSCAMNALPADQESRSRLIKVAHLFFDQLEALFFSLYPVDTADMLITVGMLNPEAGDHPVPEDIREIEAAVTAARKCREEFPYFDERFQERSRSFARSDSAWLVTLADLPQSSLLSQVEWLGRVLGNRGMPRITLERQLELLYQELSAAIPEKSDHYKGLLEAAESLKRERLQQIPEPLFSSLARDFHIATDGELRGRLSGTGSLIVAAVCDKRVGISEAVSSLLLWLSDGERFSHSWISAVKHTLEEARKNVERQRGVEGDI